jgi:hypothetical protein
MYYAVVTQVLCKTGLLCFLNELTLFCKGGNVILTTVYFRELFINNFLFVYAYFNLTNNVREGSADYSVLFYTVTKFRKTSHSHGSSRGIFAPHLSTANPLKDV